MHPTPSMLGRHIHKLGLWECSGQGSQGKPAKLPSPTLVGRVSPGAPAGCEHARAHTHALTHADTQALHQVDRPSLPTKDTEKKRSDVNCVTVMK